METTLIQLDFKTSVCGFLNVRNNFTIRRHISLSRTVILHENDRISVIENICEYRFIFFECISGIRNVGMIVYFSISVYVY